MKARFDQMYQHARRAFAGRYDASEASAMAFALLEDKYGASRTDILLGKDTEFSAEEHHDFAEIVKKIAEGLPLQYATGRALFCGRYFKVTPDTLIPRPETEKMCEELRVNSKSAIRVLDCGTGSGCIAITIALDHPEWEVEAWDICEGALAVAHENAETLGARNVTFHRRDILAEAAKDAAMPQQEPPFGGYWGVISNPPYICNREAADMEAHVLDHEPHTALFVPDDDPLLFYRALAEIARKRLLPGGSLIVECNRAYTQETAALFRAYGFKEVKILPDCFDAPRFVRARKQQ